MSKSKDIRKSDKKKPSKTPKEKKQEKNEENKEIFLIFWLGDYFFALL